MTAAMDGARLKLDRAAAHLQAITSEVQKYLTTGPYELLNRAAVEREIAAIRICVPPPRHLSALVGDCVRNLRGALDLTFWALALQTGPKDADRERIFFPIFSSELTFSAAQDGFARPYPPWHSER
jgi:hypothetical protein